MAKAIDSLGGMLPGATTKKAGRGGGMPGGGKGRTAGLAMLAGAAGLAMKNRGKLMTMFGRKDSAEHQEMTASGNANQSDAVITPRDTGSPAVTTMPPSTAGPGAGMPTATDAPGIADPPPATDTADLPPTTGDADVLPGPGGDTPLDPRDHPPAR
jgi:hypothetical protein